MRSLLRIGFLIAIMPALFVGRSVGAAPAASEQKAIARPLVSPIFGDHMVLQRGKLNPFWGWSQPGQTVRVSVGEKTADAVAGDDGLWRASVEVPAPGGPYTVTIAGDSEVTLNDVMVGDVWLCSGQSNMAMGLRGSLNGAEVAQQANFPGVRLY